ncbi:MAG: tRNA lysidine(34) synthetase TilS [Elusimicrobia bacterium]|nr:tRNA lysidine(34) synthetase TilS [Elusimicrobiota bacterium]
MRKKEFAAKIWSKLMTFQKERRLLSPADGVLAAVSGGPDSVCLAHFLAQMAPRLGLKLRILHVHHGLRGREADRDQDLVLKLGKTLNIPVTVVHADAALRARERGKGLEDAGRDLRYRALRSAARRYGCAKVATAHQLDDQAETVLLNLLRGTRLSALAGIPAERPLGPGLCVVRPLLCLKRQEILEYLRVHNLKARRDSSNLSEHFTRNWLRRRIIPALEKRQPRAREHLAGIAAQVQGSLSAKVTDSRNTGSKGRSEPSD